MSFLILTICSFEEQTTLEATYELSGEFIHPFSDEGVVRIRQIADVVAAKLGAVVARLDEELQLIGPGFMLVRKPHKIAVFAYPEIAMKMQSARIMLICKWNDTSMTTEQIQEQVLTALRDASILA